mgnify:CR=1 FL=1
MEILTKVTNYPDERKLYNISNELFGLNINRKDKIRMITYIKEIVNEY